VKVRIPQNIFKFEKIKNIITTNYKIKIICSTDTYSVRHPILRTEKPIESCVFEGDDLETTIHFGIFSEENLVGICSFYKNSHPNILETPQYQLRGMAVLMPFQNKSLGKKILRHAEDFLKEKSDIIIWCNAREIAINFYKKNGYQIIGEPFHITDIGLHCVMYKVLYSL